MLTLVGRQCKRYLDRVREKRGESVERQPCPYEGCGSHEVVFWGWYYRKGGKLPDERGESCGPIPIRRFRCRRCQRTFSWRPHFLVFGRPFAAVVYHQAFKAWALKRPEDATAAWGASAWCAPHAGARKAMRRVLNRRANEALLRMRLQLAPSARDAELGSTSSRVWYACSRLAHGTPRLACHFLWIALAAHRSATRYALEAT